MIYLVRHAHAGSKRQWTGSDGLRPLSEAGRRESAGLLTRLGGQHISAILSSPSTRCVQTVEPLSRQRSLPIRTDLRLTADTSLRDALALLLADDNADTVLCSHGELIGRLLDGLRDRGAPVTAFAEWAKGSTWQLDIADGAVVGATYLPPLAADSVPAGTGVSRP